MTTSSPGSRRAAGTRAPRDYARLAAAIAVVLVLLLVLPLALIRLRVALDPLVYEGFGALIPQVWAWASLAATAVGLVRLEVLWRRRPQVRSSPVRTGALACAPGAVVLAATLVLSLMTGAA